jgi:hypothetical protein
VVTRAAKETQRAFVTEHQIIFALQSLLKLRDTLLDKREELESLQSPDNEMHLDSSDQAAVLEKAKQNRARIEVLAKLLGMAQRGNGNDQFRRLCSDRYVKLMQRNIEHRKARVIEFATQVRKLENDITSIRTKLWREYRVSLPRHVVEQMPPVCPQVQSAFSNGVRVLAWPHLLETKIAEPGSCYVSVDTEGTMIALERTEDAVIRLANQEGRDNRRKKQRGRR